MVLKLTIEAIFEFIAKNPPSILIAGGILCFILGALISPTNPESARQLTDFGMWLVGLGIVLHIIWLIVRHR